MWFKRKKVSSGIKIDLLGTGDETEIRVALVWPDPENLSLFKEMLVMLNRGMLAPVIASDVEANDGEGAREVIRELNKIPENRKNLGDKPRAVVPPNKVTQTEMNRYNGNF